MKLSRLFGRDLLALRVVPPPLTARLLGAATVAVVLLLWWLITRGDTPEERLISPVILPSPAEVFGSISALVRERALFQSIAATLRRVLIGFGLATVIGVPAGIVAGSWRIIDASMAPLALFGRNIPIAALIPLTILWFGIEETQKVMFIFIACVPFIFVSSVAAVAAVHARYVETAQTLGANPRQVVMKVLVPLAMPEIYSSLRALFGLAFGYIMLAELINAKHGLGYLLSTSQRRGLSEHIILILLIIGVLAFVIDRSLQWFQRGLFPYTTRGEVAVTEQTASPPATVRSSDPVVTFRGVTKTFNPDTPDAFTAIKDVNFEVRDRPDHGEFVSILGPSGCGKSTILRLIAGLRPHHPATEGQVLIAGQAPGGPGADRGMVFQDYTSFDNRTVLDNVAFGLECRGVAKEQRVEQARTWVAKVGLDVERDGDKYPHQLSGGMRQRVAIARTLILTPRIILMDEPFGALDPGTRLKMQDMLVELWREAQATVFFVTHSIEEAVYLGDRVHVLSTSPGTILRELEVPRPDRPAKAMQRTPEFLDLVFDIRDMIDKLEASIRAGDD